MAQLAWVRDVLARRNEERQGMVRQAQQFIGELPASLGLVAAVLFGSVARGDFNVWSDVDVLVVALNLPELPQERLEMLLLKAPVGIQPVAWTPHEFTRQLARSNPIAREAVERGMVLYGAEQFRTLVADAARKTLAR